MLKIAMSLLKSKGSIFALLLSVVVSLGWFIYERGKEQGVSDRDTEIQQEYIETDRRIKDAPIVNDRDSALERLRESGDLR